MDFDRTQDRLFSLTASLMITASLLATAPSPVISAAVGPQPAALTNALNGLRASGWAGLKNASVPTPAVSPASAPAVPAAQAKPHLSDRDIADLAELTGEKGQEWPIYNPIATSLRLPAGADDIAHLRVITYSRAGEGEMKHAYSHLDDGGFFFETFHQSRYYFFRTDSNQNLTEAFYLDAGAHAFYIADAADAQPRLDDELRLFAWIAQLVRERDAAQNPK